MVRLQKDISFSIEKGPKFALEIVKEETDLTDEMLANGSWKAANFKPYNFNALGADQHTGALHPLMKVRQEFRQIFFVSSIHRHIILEDKPLTFRLLLRNSDSRKWRRMHS